MPSSAQRRSVVSPDGALIAIALQGSVTEIPVVAIVDTSTGEQVDSFDAAFSWQLQWTSRAELLFMQSTGNAAKVLLRDTATGTNSLVAELDNPGFWVSVAD